MQLFPCPFCGLREESEFHYGAEAGNVRPDAGFVSADQWSDYLHMRDNPKGATREIWVHLTCGEFFMMERDTVTHRVMGSTGLEDVTHSA
ncbi:MAG: sarcosine oxidase subunit delta [Rhizobiaceae bacterium]